MTDYIYDEECYPNVWTLGALNTDTKERFLFEISYRRNDVLALLSFIDTIRNDRMVGFNNLGYDYPLLHMVLMNPHCVSYGTLYEKSQGIFNSESPFEHLVWESEHIVQQIDLFKIHHFDNSNRRTSLKDLEINMCMHSVVDLPYPPGTLLNSEQIDKLINYQFHDIDATYLFYLESMEMINMREDLSKEVGVNMLNFNDTKIGKEHFVRELEKASPGICYDRSSGKKVMRQTFRGKMPYKDIIFPYIEFEHPLFKELKEDLLTKVITDTKSKEKTIVSINGFDYSFGLGGLHGSVDSQIIRETNSRIIIDVDVEGFYPQVGIVNNLYPEHLSDMFCTISSGLKTERKKYDKKHVKNKMLKLAGNGTYGASNDIYSPIYDPLYTMRTTVNGQLMLAMLAEKLISIHDLEMIQANTDGLTFSVDRQFESLAMAICGQWEFYTGMKLERADYSLMAIRDVNNYLAVYKDGSLKNKGCYVHDCEWHKDHSHKIVAKAAEAAIVHGKDIKEFICGQNHSMFDFMGKAKVPRTSKLVKVDKDGNDFPEQRISRYFITHDGYSLVKVMPPLPKKLSEDVNSPWRRIGISPTTKWKCTVVNTLPSESWFWGNINYDFYIQETEKIVLPLMR